MISRKVAVFAISFSLSAGALASTPIPDPLPLKNYVSVFGKFIATGHFESVVGLSNELDSLLKNPNSSVELEHLRFETGNSKSQNIFLVIVNAELRWVSPERRVLSRVKKCSFEKIYISSDFNRGTLEYNAYHQRLLGKDVVLFLEPPIHYLGNGGKLADKFYIISNGPNWINGAPKPISELDSINEVAANLGFIARRDIDCK